MSALEQAQCRVGRVLRSRWRLDSLIGIGGSSAVYRATHRNGSRVAIKVLHPALVQDDDTKKRFIRESYVANALGIRDVVKVIDDDLEDDLVYLVMELLEGATLDTLRQRAGGVLSVSAVLEVTQRLLRVLEVAHRRGVVHRDIKPSNLFRTKAPVGFKVLDFGIARVRWKPDLDSEGTIQGVTMGTPAFMAPEQACGLWREVDERTDLWAVAATAFTLLTGRPVHEGRTSNEVLGAATQRRAPPVRDVAENVPEAVAQLVDRGLAFDRADRFQSATQMRLACAACYQRIARTDQQPAFFSNAGVASAASDETTAELQPRSWTSRLLSTRVRSVPGVWTGSVGSLWWFYYTGPSVANTWERYLEFAELLLQTREAKAFAFFTHLAEVPSATQRRQIAQFLEEHYEELRCLKRFALVFDSPWHRRALTAVKWLASRPYEERVFDNPVAALNWTTQVTPDVDAAAVRASIVSEVPEAVLRPELKGDAAVTLPRAVQRHDATTWRR